MPAAHSPLRFGPYVLDPARFELRKHGIRIRLQRQPCKLLLLLISNAPHVVTRDRMRQELWPDGTQVDFDRSLNFCIFQIRAALSDQAATPLYIDTVPREGYRFIGELLPSEPATPDSIPTPLPPPQSRRPLSVYAIAALVLLLAAGAWLFAHRAAPPPPLTVSPLTGLAGRVRGPDFSPDAKHLAFSWSKEIDTTAHIYVKLTGSSEVLPITSGEGVVDSFPLWTPDGKTIVFCREQGNQAALFQVPALGGAPQFLTAIGSAPFFTNLFRRPFSILPSSDLLASIFETGQSRRIFRLSPDGSQRTVLTAPPQGWMGDILPTASPDGKSFAFVRSQASIGTELHVQSLTSSSPAQKLLGDAQIGGLSWSLDGQSLIFSGVYKTVQGLWHISASGGEPHLLHATADFPRDITLSRQGALAAYTVENPRVDLWRATLGIIPSDARPIVSSNKRNWAPKISPDGRKIAYYTNLAGFDEVWIANADGANPHRLTTGIWPAWSPDSQQIAYMRFTEDGSSDIFVSPANGGPTHRLTSEIGLDDWPEWSPDGQWIFFTSRRSGRSEIWKTPANGTGNAIQITRHGGATPRVFDGYVYFRSWSEGIKRTPLNGGPELLIAPGVADFHPLPGGLYLLPSNSSQLLRLDYRTGKTHPVATLDKPIAGFAISADEKWIVHGHADNMTFEMMLLTNLPTR